jgi:hypothetical protein
MLDKMYDGQAAFKFKRHIPMAIALVAYVLEEKDLIGFLSKLNIQMKEKNMKKLFRIFKKFDEGPVSLVK